MKNLKKILFVFFVIFLVMILGVSVAQLFWEPFYIPSGSMQPTVLPGDVVWVNKHVEPSQLKAGDVIVFRVHSAKNQIYIKRIVATEFDRVRLEGEHVYINDVLLPQTPHVVKKRSNPDSCFVDLKDDALEGLLAKDVAPLPYAQGYKNYSYFIEENRGKNYWVQFENKKTLKTSPAIQEWIVPESSFFVLGDHRTNSSDSRDHGFVSFSDVVGVADSIWFSVAPKAYACGKQYLKYFDLYFRSLRQGQDL